MQGGAPRVEPTWQTVLLKRLQQYKRYPQSAQTSGEQGVVLLGFSVDRNGRVLEHRIVQSSGHADLDNEVMAMIERAQPLPAFPAGMTQRNSISPSRSAFHSADGVIVDNARVTVWQDG